MGQGTESCGGYEIEYDPYEEELSSVTPVWITQHGEHLPVHEMSTRHLRNTKRLCENLSASATFSCDTDKWDAWVEVFESELATRTEKSSSVKQPGTKAPAAKPRGKKQHMQCHCGTKYYARIADIKRGWGLSCCKRCAAIRRDFGRPAAKAI